MTEIQQVVIEFNSEDLQNLTVIYLSEIYRIKQIISSVLLLNRI